MNTRAFPGDGRRRAARSKAAREAQGYDAKPPRCGDCINFVPCGHKRGGRWIPPTCAIGGFAVETFGVCDLWRSTSGETLEQPAQEINHASSDHRS